MVTKEARSAQHRGGLLGQRELAGRGHPSIFIEYALSLLLSFTYPTDIEAGTEYERQEQEDGD